MENNEEEKQEIQDIPREIDIEDKRKLIFILEKA
jgi:hypothetical protein